ncbi:hypothetical protein [Clostridium sp. OF09-36]|uniref:hypothetical protein n=1 Tax=Clostridium sp. OF09-36 TaxID=2292310 RepID=UPI0015FD1F2C|nr:hypothetical protein [Clostridium sp. OF09-36]
MRKIIALATAAAMCLSMTACSVSVSTSETTKAAETTAETTAAESSEAAADSDLVATADYPTKPINMIILTEQAEPPMCGAESLQPFLKNI